MEKMRIFSDNFLVSFVVFSCLSCTCFAGYCSVSSQCDAACYRAQRTETNCGIFGWSWAKCTKYRAQVYTCTTLCYKRACCPGYQDPNCNTPICYGDTTCPNGGTCVSPDTCACTAGYGGNLCSDLDECDLGSSGCSQLCQNTPGSYYCTCRDGYVLGSDSHACEDVDECNDDSSNCEQVCNNTPGSFTCSCNDGYMLASNGFDCTDVDECTLDISGCAQLCQNTQGSYICGCGEGYVLSNDSRTCEDQNECGQDKGGCDQICVNQDGDHQCECHGGYELHTDGQTCLDINECTRNTSGCHQLCNNTAGSFVCSCRSGYILADDRKSCNETLPGDQEEQQSDSAPIETGAIVGIVVGCVVVIALLLVVTIFYCRYRRRNNSSTGRTRNRFDNNVYGMDNSNGQQQLPDQQTIGYTTGIDNINYHNGSSHYTDMDNTQRVSVYNQNGSHYTEMGNNQRASVNNPDDSHYTDIDGEQRRSVHSSQYTDITGDQNQVSGHPHRYDNNAYEKENSNNQAMDDARGNSVGTKDVDNQDGSHYSDIDNDQNQPGRAYRYHNNAYEGENNTINQTTGDFMGNTVGIDNPDESHYSEIDNITRN